ncbi:hypothetical protein DV738_g1046, partial [Chaetothyriales sp. CBS 135597]
MDRPVRPRKEDKISFGALAEAQAAAQGRSSGGGSNSIIRGKRKAGADTADPPTQHDDDDNDNKYNSVQARASKRHQTQHRSSKHAPTILSSKTQVSRSRTIFTPAAAVTKSRDPRFDPARRVAELKRQLMSIEAKVRNAQTRQRQADILAEHKRQEKAALAEGRKARPYYLKESVVKKQIAEERRESMGKQARDKADRRRAKRDKTKAAREMPRVRRGMQD